MVPVLWGAAAWLTSNAVGLNDLLNNWVNPSLTTPPKTGGNDTFISYLNNGYDFQLRIHAPSNDDIQAIDDFFESYGYRVDRFQIPDLNVRSSFTFIKTHDAVVYSSVTNAAQQLQAMLNSGTKFWSGEIGK